MSIYRIEIRSVPEVNVDLFANQVEQVRLTRYPLPNNITVDRGKELLAELKIVIKNDYKQTQLWKEFTKLLVILYIPLLSKKWI